MSGGGSSASIEPWIDFDPLVLGWSAVRWRYGGGEREGSALGP